MTEMSSDEKRREDNLNARTPNNIEATLSQGLLDSDVKYFLGLAGETQSPSDGYSQPEECYEQGLTECLSEEGILVDITGTARPEFILLGKLNNLNGSTPKYPVYAEHTQFVDGYSIPALAKANDQNLDNMLQSVKIFEGVKRDIVEVEGKDFSKQYAIRLDLRDLNDSGYKKMEELICKFTQH